MDAFESRFSSRLRDSLAEDIVERLRQLAAVISPDYETYREKVGFIKGLEFAAARAVEIEKDMGRGEQKGPEQRKQHAPGKYET